MGEFRKLSRSTSWRMPEDLYFLLELSREWRSEKRGREFSLGQELLFRLRDSFDTEKDRDWVTRAINSRLRKQVDSKQAIYSIRAIYGRRERRG